MKKPIFTGCGVALITPFLENSIDYYSLERLLTFHDAKSDAIILLGTTGEASTLSLSERKEIITFSRKIIKKVPLIVGCGGLSTEICRTLVKMAETLSADGILAVLPFTTKAQTKVLSLITENFQKFRIYRLFYTTFHLVQDIISAVKRWQSFGKFQT